MFKGKYRIPGPKSKELLKISERYEARCMNQQAPIVWDYAKGVTVTDVDGNTYIDLTSGVLVTNVGHSHPDHVARIQKQAARLMNCYDFPTPERIMAAQGIAKLMPKNLDRVFMLTTGSEATESAMRVAKRYTGKFEIISFYGGFHGRTGMAMSAAGKTGTKKRFGPLVPGHIYAPFPYCFRCPFHKKPQDCNLFCLEFLDTVVGAASTGDVAALIIEPYQGAAGFVFPPDGYLKKLEKWAKERDIIFILDEVQASFGRTGKMFAMEWDGLRPNMLCLGKGIGSGVPCAALVAESRIIDCLAPGEMSSTTGGNPLSCSATLAVLDIMKKEKLPENALKIGKYMLGRFKKFQRKYKVLGEARGRGLVMGLEFVKDKKTMAPAPDITREFITRACKSGLLVGSVGIYGNVIRVAPPLVITRSEAEQACDIIETVLKSFR